MNQHRPFSADILDDVIRPHLGNDGPLLPILHDIQETFGCVPKEAVPPVAEALNLSRAEVHGVVTFYHDFRELPPGRNVLKICRAEACQAAGGNAVAAHVEKRLGVALGATTADGRVTVEPIFCLGLCATAPSAMLNGKVVGRLDEARVDEMLAEVQS